MFHPGILDLKERQRHYISDLETHPVKFILLSNRTTEDYGLPFLGLDFNQQSVLGSNKTSLDRRIWKVFPANPQGIRHANLPAAFATAIKVIWIRLASRERQDGRY